MRYVDGIACQITLLEKVYHRIEHRKKKNTRPQADLVFGGPISGGHIISIPHVYGIVVTVTR